MTDHAIDTQLIHAGELRPRIDGAVTMPIFQSSTYEYKRGDEQGVRYIRYNNTPNHMVLHDKLAALEGGAAGLVTSSGMAAISAVLLGLLKQGDHLIALDTLYGATQSFMTEDLPRFGIECTLVDGTRPDTWAAARRPTTRVLYSESITNPQLCVPDHTGLARFARDHDLISVIDNTFASPVNFRPLAHGYDITLHSCSKYLAGHTDLVAGAVVGSAAHVTAVARMLKHLGGTLDPHACFLLHRGMRTLALRVRRQNDTALAVARFLQDRPEINCVNYPGLKDDPGHGRASELFAGYGGMVAFEVKGGLEAAERLLDRVTLLTVAPSLGGPETLITSPVATSHAGQSPAERARAGIPDGMLRMSIGFEDPQDLIADLEHGLG